VIQHCPTPTELDDLELLVSGAYAPLSRFNEDGSVVTLDLPDGATEAEVVDPEGLPLARVAADGSLEPLTHAQYGPFRRLHLTPAQAREQHAGATFVPVVDALTEADLEELFAIAPVSWSREADLTEEFYATFDGRVPAALQAELAALRYRLKVAQKD
jgi:sulfate adenylyltransferase